MKYDLAKIAAIFLDRRMEESVRAELVKRCAEAVRRPAAPMQALLAAITEHCLEHPLNTPMNTIAIGVIYGMAVGALAEGERRAGRDGAAYSYDFTEIASCLVFHKYDEDARATLMRELDAAVHMPVKPVQLLLARVAEDCAAQPRCSPVNTVQVAMIYGIPLGILCEEDRRRREERVVQ